MKYIDADKLRAEIDAFYTEYKAKFHQNGDSYHLGIIDGLDMAERILDTMPDESEQPTRGYDEAYLNEKIAKASKSWEGVDVDKFMDEVRGREPATTCNQLEEATEKYLEDEMEKFGERWPYPASFDGYDKDWVDELAEECAKHFYELGKKDMKRKMMEGAVEGYVGVHLHDKRADVTVNSGYLPKEMGIKGDSKVKIIIVKEEEQ